MELIDRYLSAVKFWLPKESKDDIVRELGENLQAQMDDKAEALGRPLTEGEQAEVLKKHGDPMLAASRYWPRQHLIGPGLFMVYSFVLKIVLTLTAVGTIAAHLTGDPGDDVMAKLGAALIQVPGSLLMTFAWITLVFAAIDFAHTRFMVGREWDPRSLPKAKAMGKRGSRFEQVCEIVAGCVGIAWWIAIPHYPFLLFGPAALFLTLTPAWGTLYIPVIMLAGISMLMRYTRLIRPDLSWLKQAVEVAGRLVTLVVVSLMLKAGPLIALAPNGGADLAKVADGLNLIIKVGLEVGSLVATLQLAWAVYKLIRSLPSLLGRKEVML